MRIKSISVEMEDRFPRTEQIEQLWKEIKTEGTKRLVVALDGAPGAGKSVLAQQLHHHLKIRKIPSSLIEADWDILPWHERPKGSELMDWIGFELLQEVIRSPFADFIYKGYDSVTHDRTQLKHIQVPEQGVVIFEGLRSIERALEFSEDPVVAIHLRVPEEIREIRRIIRNIATGRWKKEEAQSRTQDQRRSSQFYFGDLRRELAKSSSGIHNELRQFKL